MPLGPGARRRGISTGPRDQEAGYFGAPLLLLLVATAASAAASAAVSPTPPPPPPWPAEWNLTRSTVVQPGTPSADYFTPANAWGLVSIDWGVASAIWSKGGRSASTCEAVSVEGCRRLKAAGKASRCFIYHNFELALEWLESQHRVMRDDAKADWFLQFTDGHGHKNGVRIAQTPPEPYCTVQRSPPTPEPTDPAPPAAHPRADDLQYAEQLGRPIFLYVAPLRFRLHTRLQQPAARHLSLWQGTTETPRPPPTWWTRSWRP